jgi:hypothetical protein
MSETPSVLAREGNAAVVHLNQRRFPGVMLQGDTFNGVVQSILFALNASSHDTCREELRRVLIDLQECVAFYERTLRDRGFEIPYSKNSGQ